MAKQSLPNELVPQASQAAFLHSVAHELSTPLTPLVGYLKILQSGKLGALNEHQLKVLEAMSHSASHLALIIDNLVDLADLEAGRHELRLGDVVLKKLLADGLEDARVAGRSKRLTVEALGGEGLLIRADEIKLRQAIANLLDNAVRFSRHGGVVLGEILDLGDRAELAIYDQGPGLDASDLERLSAPFSHAAVAYPQRRPGAGLGLPVARRIAEAHGGELRAESPPQNQPRTIHHFAGTRVSLVLPKAGPAPASAA
jgi:signal transduction histidine kinase